MANVRGNMSTYDQSAGVLEDLSSAVRFGAAYDAPLYSFLNRKPATDRDHKWIEDAPNTRSTTVNESGTVTNVATTIAVTDGSLFGAGDVIVMDSEYMRVSSVAGNELTVSRDQLRTLVRLFLMNTRGVQEAHGRRIEANE